jgi:hypothetical protein
MNEWPGTGGQGQPADQPFGYIDPGQQPGWPGGFQQPGPLQPGPLQPVQPAGTPVTAGEPVLVVIGDISVTSTTVYTPSGSRPLAEVSWTFTDMSVTSQNIPTWAIVCAIVFFLACFLGLLFLLAKENTTTGSVQVTVHGPGFLHTTTIPVSSPQQVADINARVNYARTLTASYPGQQAQIQQAQIQQWPQGQQPSQPGQQWPQGQQPGQPGQQPGQPW